MISVDATERSAIASAVDLNEQYLYQCFTGRRKLPPKYAPGIELASAGRITCEQLRDDLVWVRVPDATWPHAEGRPCLDFAALPAATADDEQAAC